MNKFTQYAEKLENLKLACLKKAATIDQAEKAIIPITQKVLNDLQRRFKMEGVSRVQLLKEFPIKESQDGEYFYIMSIYGLMTQENASGRCGVLTIQTNYSNDDEIVTTQIKMKLGSDPTVIVESGSPVGVITRALNYITKLVRADKGFSYWAKTYTPSKDKTSGPAKIVRN